MPSAFTAATRSADEHLEVRPPLHHKIAYVTGGYKILLDRIKTRNVPKQPVQGYFTDKDGHFNLKGACLIGSRYKVIKVLDPKGQSAVLVLAEDLFDDRKLVVIKVLHTQYFQIGIQESHVLSRLAALDPLNISHTLRLLTTVEFDSHYCLVFEPLLPDPLTTVFADLPHHKVLNNIRKVGLRLLTSIGFMHHHNMIHTDLKPENLLLRDDCELDSVHIVDFGNTLHYVHSEVSLYYKDFELQTPLYRAPEVMFGMPFGVEIDMWSLGCIFAELYLGEALFLGRCVEDILSKIVDILGPFPSQLFRRGKYYKKYQRYTKDSESMNGTLQLMEHLQCKDVLFADLLAGLLKYDPGERLTASEAACHPFFASLCPVAFLLPTTSCNKGQLREATGGLCPKSYPFTPAIAADIKKRQPSSVELLNLGTAELPQINETFLLKPSPKTGTFRRQTLMGRNIVQGQDTSMAVSFKGNGESATGQSDMSVVRNVMQTQQKGNFSTNVKEKMSELLRAIRAEQDLVESDLERKDRTLIYDRSYKRGDWSKEEKVKITKGDNFADVISNEPRYEKVKQKSEIMQPRPTYRSYIDEMRSENEKKDTKVKSQNLKTIVSNEGRDSDRYLRQSGMKSLFTEYNKPVDVCETFPQNRDSKQHNTQTKSYLWDGEQPRKTMEKFICKPPQSTSFEDDTNIDEIRRRSSDTLEDDCHGHKYTSKLYKKLTCSNQPQNTEQTLIRPELYSKENNVEVYYSKQLRRVSRDTSEASDLGKIQRQKVDCLHSASGRHTHNPTRRSKSQEQLVLSNVSSDENTEDNNRALDLNTNRQIKDTAKGLRKQRTSNPVSQQSADITVEDLLTDTTYVVGKHSSPMNIHRRNTSRPHGKSPPDCIKTTSTPSSDRLKYTGDRRLHDETTDYGCVQRMPDRNIKLSHGKMNRKDANWQDGLTLSNTKRSNRQSCPSTMTSPSSSQTDQEFEDLSPDTDSAELLKRRQYYTENHANRVRNKQNKHSMYDKIQKSKEFGIGSFDMKVPQGASKTSYERHKTETNKKSSFESQAWTISGHCQARTTLNSEHSEGKKQRNIELGVNKYKKDNVKRKLISSIEEKKNIDHLSELSNKRRKSQFIN